MRRSSTKSLLSRIDETHALIDKELAAGTERPARLTLLKVKLESLMELLKREDKPVVPKAEESPATPSQPATTPPDPLDDIVKGMLQRHASQPTTAIVTVPTMTRSERLTPLPPVEDDEIY
jgi:hypothetical protein